MQYLKNNLISLKFYMLFQKYLKVKNQRSLNCSQMKIKNKYLVQNTVGVFLGNQTISDGDLLFVCFIMMGLAHVELSKLFNLIVNSVFRSFSKFITRSHKYNPDRS